MSNPGNGKSDAGKKENGVIDGAFVVGKEYDKHTIKLDLLEAQVLKDEEEARNGQCRPFKDIRSEKLSGLN